MNHVIEEVGGLLLDGVSEREREVWIESLD